MHEAELLYQTRRSALEEAANVANQRLEELKKQNDLLHNQLASLMAGKQQQQQQQQAQAGEEVAGEAAGAGEANNLMEMVCVSPSLSCFSCCLFDCRRP